MSQGVSGVQSSSGKPGSGEMKVSVFLSSPLNQTYRALEALRRRLDPMRMVVVGQNCPNTAQAWIPRTINCFAAVKALWWSSTATSTKGVWEAGALHTNMICCLFYIFQLVKIEAGSQLYLQIWQVQCIWLCILQSARTHTSKSRPKLWLPLSLKLNNQSRLSISLSSPTKCYSNVSNNYKNGIDLWERGRIWSRTPTRGSTLLPWRTGLDWLKTLTELVGNRNKRFQIGTLFFWSYGILCVWNWPWCNVYHSN